MDSAPEMELAAQPTTTPEALVHGIASVPPKRSRSRGFTVVEMLVVISIIAIISALTAAVVVQQIGAGRRTKTEMLIQMLNTAIQERRESFWATDIKNLRGVDPQYANLAAALTGEPTALQRRRADLLAKLDAERGAFPQSFEDFLRYNEGGLSPNNLGGGARNAIFLKFIQTKKSPPMQPITFDPTVQYERPDSHQPQTESSECLYLILSSAASEGISFQIADVPADMIADTDNDGLMEFVDGWGTPLRFYRWPCDYIRYLAEGTGDLSQSAVSNAVDPDGMLTKAAWQTAMTGIPRQARIVFEEGEGAAAGPLTPPAVRSGRYFRIHDVFANRPNAQNPFSGSPLTGWNPDTAIPYLPSVTPIIVSAGPDGLNYPEAERWKAFGLAWPDDGSHPEIDDLDSRCARPGGLIDMMGAGTFQFDQEMVENLGDNIVSITIRSGRGN